MAWTTVGDIEARWVGADRHKASPETIEAWIADAEELIRFEFPDIEDRIDDGDLPLARVRMVVAQVVLRILRNPEGHRAVATGPMSVTFAGDHPGGLALTDDEKAMLSADRGRRASSIDTAPTTTVTHDEVCSLNFGATYCSCGAILTGSYPLWGSLA